jgi:cysteine-rich repeat protein
MRNYRLKNLMGFVLALTISVGILFAAPTLAQDVDLESFAESAGLSTSADVTVIIAKLIRTGISLLGIVAVLFTLYGGYVWMTSKGDPAQVTRAKGILSSAVIGLILVFSAFAITQFILNALVDATGGGVSGSESSSSGYEDSDSSSSSIFYLSSVNNECSESLMNLELQFVFSKALESDTVADGITVSEVGGGAIDGTFSVSGRTATFTPPDLCEGYTDTYCFDADTSYTISLDSTQIESTRGASLTCTTSYPCSFEFTTGSSVDTQDPSISLDAPEDGESVFVGSIEGIRALTSDDSGVSTVYFYVVDDDEAIYTAGVDYSDAGSVLGGSEANAFFTDDAEEWNTEGYTTNEEYDIWATGYDCAGNSDNASSVSIVLRAANCNNGILDTSLGEEEIDCGGDSSDSYYCGACDDAECSTDSECASGQCIDGACETIPKISEVSPGDGAPGNLITITGEGFGDEGGSVTFLGTETGDEVEVAAYSCNEVAQWSDDEIIIQVPTGAVDGPISVNALEGDVERTDDTYGASILDFDVNAIERPGICLLDPDSASYESSITISGNSFGDSIGTSAFYFSNYEPTSYVDWSDDELEVVVPNLSSRTYRAQVFTGDYVCTSSDGVSTGVVCSEDDGCDTEVGESCATAWCSETLDYCEDDDECGEGEGTCESIRVGSNKVMFTAEDTSSESTPIIANIDSGWVACSGGSDDGVRCTEDSDCDSGSCEDAVNWGPAGQYLTIYGSNFGSATGSVFFQGSDTALGDSEFPEACGEDFWHDSYITIKVPETYQTESASAIQAGTHDLYIQRQDGEFSSAVDFVVLDDTPGPAICDIDPSAGPAGTPITIYGENLGEDEGSVLFHDNQTATYTDWSNSEIEDALVPEGAATGPVYIVEASSGYTSNSITFNFGDCNEISNLCEAGESCCADGSCSTTCDESEEVSTIYAYKISTGLTPLVPRVLVECSGTRVSPGPWEGWSQPDDICVNAAIEAEFSLTMDEDTINVETVIVEKCTDVYEAGEEGSEGDCATWEEVTPDSDSPDPYETGLSWEPAGEFETDTTYRVTLLGDDNIRASSEDGAGYLESDYIWEFTTSSDGTYCEVGEVNLRPASHTEAEQTDVNYAAQLVAQNDNCVPLSCNGFTLEWESSFSGAVLAVDEVVGSCSNSVDAQAETPSGSPAIITAAVNAVSEPSDNAELIINFTDPEVDEYFPQCTTACINAMPWVIFNTNMDHATVGASTVSMYVCGDSLCDPSESSTELIDFVDSISYPEGSEIMEIVFSDGSDGGTQEMEPNTWYRIVLDGEVIASQTGVTLSESGSNYGEAENRYFEDDFSWVFKTKDDDVSCSIDSITLYPASVIMSYVGERQEFNAIPRGAPDDCSESGQALQSGDYDWEAWVSTDNPNNEGDETGDFSDQLDIVSYAILDGEIELTSDIPSYCSSVCLNMGSTITIDDGACGNGDTETYEECDDGGSEDGDGCSAECLYEGTDSAEEGGTCGDGSIDEFEECDGGDGCSEQCLNLGSRSIGATCGDESRDWSLATGGEDCDDGNTTSGDGCSSNCLNEGSVVYTSTLAICGNAIIEAGEDCDPGDYSADGDGCSESCLNEGTSACPSDTSTNCCGNETEEAGEECDGQEGCSSSCLWEGSSIDYDTPSFCGDGDDTGTAEECDAVDTSSLASGDYAVVQVATGAPFEVDVDTGLAVSEVTVIADGDVEGTAELSLDCSCTTANSCSEGGIGCGNSDCCFVRPEIVEDSITPANNTDPFATPDPGHCRNTAVSVTFSDIIETSSFDTTQDDDGVGGISEDEFSANLYLDLVSLDGVDVEDAASCPEAYTGIALAMDASGSFLARAWSWVKQTVLSVFGAQVSASDSYYCYVPISYESIQSSSGEMTVYLRYEQLLEENAEYRIVIVGDDDGTDLVKEGLLSQYDVSLCIEEGCTEGQFTHSFYVGEDICRLEKVDLDDNGERGAEDYESASARYFTQSLEVHEFEAVPLTFRSGIGYEEISPTDDYDWSWSWDSSVSDDSDDDIIEVREEAEYDTQTFYRASGNSGRELAIATATITTDDLAESVEESTVEDETTGTVEVEAFVCENPWPEISRTSDFPYVEETASTNFSFYYCRDVAEGSSDDILPELETPIDVSSLTSAGLIQELIFKVDGTSDAIGVRVLPNSDYLSPSAWVEDQEFTGSFSEAQLDGYEAVELGTTIYATSGNIDGTDIYPNIYIVSYNEDAGSEAQEIFEQILNYWKFNANTEEVSDVNLCWNGVDYVKDSEDEYVSCSWDGACYESCADEDCTVEGRDVDAIDVLCHAEKAQLTRDMKRLTDITDIKETLTDFGEANMHCGVTTSMSCDQDSDCPGTETCVEGFPLVQSGTFVPALTNSVWGSWNSALANELQSSIPTDPINEFYNCSTDGYDSESCWNGEAGTFLCPDRSHVYAYQGIAGEEYKLYAQLETSGDFAWTQAIDDDLTDEVEIIIEYPDGYASTSSSVTYQLGFTTSAEFCDASTWGDSEICGDGIQGTSEDCEVGDTITVRCTDSSGDDGLINVSCPTDTCEWYSTDRKAAVAAAAEGAECVPYECGNGIVEDSEECDDGSLNGSYGHCGELCTFDDAFYCGDGYLAGSEACDCASTTNHTDALADSDSWAAINVCTVANGLYSSDYDTSCSYDCTFPGLSCGDEVVNGAEECDGDYEEWNGAWCADGTACSSDSDCDSGACGDLYADCGVGDICSDFDDVGDACTSNAQCDSGTCSASFECEGASDVGDSCNPSMPSVCDSGTCNDFDYELIRYRSCGGTCSWDTWSACVGGGEYCGNGIIEGGEDCDDGNMSNNDACLNTCIANTCGDDYVYVGSESCDDGSDNGTVCEASYGGTCNYCNESCQYKARSGGFCGDGETNGSESCDGGYDISFTYFDMETNDTRGACSDQYHIITDSDSNTYTCGWVGVCNGGASHGDFCTLNYDSWLVDGGVPDDVEYASGEDGNRCGTDSECVPPVCAADCGSSCPVNYETTGLLVQSELAGAIPTDTIDLYSYLNAEGNSPDSAVIYVPACEVATEITADISRSGVELPSTNIIFVTDLSGSMSLDVNGYSTASTSSTGQSRVQLVVDSTTQAIESIFDVFEDAEVDVQIGLVGYNFTSTSSGAASTRQVITKSFQSSAGESVLLSSLDLYPSQTFGNTPTGYGMEEAIALMGGSSADNQIIILLSDGSPYENTHEDPCGGTWTDYASANAGTYSTTHGTSVAYATTYLEEYFEYTIDSTDWAVDDSKRCAAEVRMDLINENPDMTFYSITLAGPGTSSVEELQGWMAYQSSEECDLSYGFTDGLDACNTGTYAFQAETDDDMTEIYSILVDSIIGTQVSLTASDASGTTTTTTGSVSTGSDVELPFPEDFVCQTTEQLLPFKNLFSGDGAMMFEDFTFTYCPVD